MISYKIEYSPSAFADIEAIYEYISVELKAEQAAKNQVGNIRNKIRSLDIMPERFSIVDWEPWLSMQMRKMPVDNYIVFYSVDDISRTVTVVRVFYGGRNIEEIISSESD